MKTTTSVIMTGCFVMLLAGTLCFAAEVAEQKEAAAINKQAVDQSAAQQDQKLRAWVGSIKPAAGPVTPSAHPENEYWHQSVRRENRGSMHE